MSSSVIKYLALRLAEDIHKLPLIQVGSDNPVTVGWLMEEMERNIDDLTHLLQACACPDDCDWCFAREVTERPALMSPEDWAACKARKEVGLGGRSVREHAA